MGAQLDIAPRAGCAAPGEYSPKALLTTPGGLLICDASGNPVPLAVGARGGLLYVPSAGVPAWKAKGSAGQAAGWDANDLVALTPPGWPIPDMGRAYTGDGATTPETSLLAAGVATAGMFAAGVAVGDAWDLSTRFTILDNTGNNTYTVRLRTYFGAYPVDDITTPALTASATSRILGIDLRLVVETLGAAGTGTLRVSGRRFGLDTVVGVGTGWRTIAGNVYAEKAGESTGTSAAPALITNAAQDFNVTAVHSNNSALITTSLKECTVRYYPKNR